MTNAMMVNKALRTIRGCVSLTQLKVAWRFAWLVMDNTYKKPGQERARVYVKDLIESTRDRKVDELIIS